MNKMKIYLDTSVISHMEAEDTPDKMQDTKIFWKSLNDQVYDVHISSLTVAELEKCPEPKRSLLFSFLSAIDYMSIIETRESINLADNYIKYGVLGPRNRDDCRHIALATIAGCKYIVSWNFKHFVNIRVINKVQAVNRLLGYDEIAILPPSMMIGGDEDDIGK